jgi:hypothetical protein
MGFASAYLEKHQRTTFEIAEAPSGLLCYCIIIPAYREPYIIGTLQSIKNCTSIDVATEVLIHFNYPENDTDERKNETALQYTSTKDWCSKNQSELLRFFVLISPDLPEKFAGVGLARKLVMDLAILRLNQLDKSNGLIFSLDADTIVPENYLSEIHSIYKKKPQTNCFVFNFAHAVSGNDYDAEVYRAAALYELHLRYYKQILQSIGFPYYQFTIGSCFAVCASAYTKSGGMNKRKAGEDFYFLQKVFMLGNIEFVRNVILQPSSRKSDRVPFGTGAAINKIVGSETSEYNSYHPELFNALKQLFELLPDFYSGDRENIEAKSCKLSLILKEFLEMNDYLKNIEQAKQNTASLQSFIKRFYTWFDAFKVMKFLNFARESKEYQIGTAGAVNLYIAKEKPLTVLQMLEVLRENDLKE